MNPEKVRAVASYLTKCGDEDPVVVARRELEKIDDKLDRINQAIVRLRARKQLCKDVLTQLGESDARKIKRTPAPSIDLDDESEENVKVRDRIVELLTEAERLTKQELMQGSGGYGDDSRINRNLKVLGERGIIARDEDLWVRGPNWES